jgi:hypothetical protein
MLELPSYELYFLPDKAPTHTHTHTPIKPALETTTTRRDIYWHLNVNKTFRANLKQLPTVTPTYHCKIRRTHAAFCEDNKQQAQPYIFQSGFNRQYPLKRQPYIPLDAIYILFILTF